MFRSVFGLGSLVSRPPLSASAQQTPILTQSVRGMAQLLRPHNTKYRKAFKGRVSEVPVKSEVVFGEYGLRVLEASRITAAQIDAIKTTVQRRIKAFKGKVHLRIFPDIPVSSKPAEVRMGKGKGAVDYFCARVRPNKVIVEVKGAVPEEAAREALKQASYMLGVKTRFERRQDQLSPSALLRPLPDPEPMTGRRVNLEKLPAVAEAPQTE
eukprot:comp20066_c0_seq1/m.24680 comp20066_c0_seq1/g.24680  ORF comp20066_c0_seq1/g.24680 comp20066_c0_seq1/m.24680 type:complete len:211 (-) comp20066_c0_seq1:773-1405(-)